MFERLPDHVTSKVHFITDYPCSIETHGFSIIKFCIRFEAKHLYFKQFAIRTFKYEKPVLTLSKCHQTTSLYVKPVKLILLLAIYNSSIV